MHVEWSARTDFRLRIAGFDWSEGGFQVGRRDVCVIRVDFGIKRRGGFRVKSCLKISII